ncbi:hypothetical protein PQU92_00770 [Asticcacaulis sp. BYS171W]|uniref:DUF4412 domain-containing protein n=1 Tax=Asticcacaulis aquaticus TaxID=2984212 RepID=A0ABT5HP11_9CAUL|nr:hypothetical protein [Asticcacaulis aquaticus]MDC7681790.1 hypothetical protein [Asticcacaulis aquaticus]
MRALIFGCLLIGAACAAKAQTVPDLYAKIRLAGFEAPIELRRSGDKTRIDLNAAGVQQTYIVDQERGILVNLIVTNGRRLALVFPADRGAALLPLPIDMASMEARGAVLKPMGASLLAGQPCRLIEFSGYLNQSGVICVNAAGLILQMTQKGRNAALFQVSSLTTGAQDAKWFSIPPDYQTVALPGVGGAAERYGSEDAAGKPGAPSDKAPVKSPFRTK